MKSSLPAIFCVLCCTLALAAEPVAHWPMDALQDGLLLDASGHGHDAVASGLNGKLPEVVPGLAGNCLRFTAASEQYLEVKQSESLQALPAMTVMAWIKPVARGGTYEIITNKGDKSGPGPWPGWRLRYFWSRAGFQFGTADSTEPNIFSPEWSTSAGFWSHVALTYDGKKMIMYINAEPVAEEQVTAPIMPSKRAFIIGNYIGRKNAYAFDGLMDELKIYGEVLDAEAIYTAASQGMTR